MALLSSIAFSQTSTVLITDTKDSLVCLPKSVAKEVVKDLIRKDSLESELVVITKNKRIMESNLILKDSIITNKDKEISIYKLKGVDLLYEISLKNKQIIEYRDLSTKLEKQLNKAKRNKLITESITIASILTAVLLGVIAL